MFLLAAVGALLAAVYLLYELTAHSEARYSVALVAACVLAFGFFLMLAKGALRPDADSEAPADYRHATHLFGATVLVVAGLGAGLSALVPDGYGRYGPYRADAVVEARAQTPRHRGEAECATCHEKEVGLHDKDAHAAVPCEACHGPGLEHSQLHQSRAGAEATTENPIPDAARMRLPKDRDSCLRCHSIDPARPGAFPQIEWQEHMRLSGIKDENLPCTTCHNPHEPLFMDRDLRQARLHPMINRCQDCHGRAMKEDTPLPEEHAPMFSCAYCHEELVRKSQDSPHIGLACTTCHPFFKESRSAGRIIRDTDPRFCLLCHERAPFRDRSKSAPLIKWPNHRNQMKDGPEDLRQRCNECHRWNLHWPEEEPGYVAPEGSGQ